MDPRDVYEEVHPGTRVVTDDEIADAVEKLRHIAGHIETSTAADRQGLKLQLLELIEGDTLVALGAADRSDWEPVLTRLKHVRGFGTVAKDVIAAILGEQQRQAAQGYGLDLVKDFAPALQAPEKCKVPFGYQMTASAVLRRKNDSLIQICRRPVFPVQRLLGNTGIGLVIAVVAERGQRRVFEVDLSVATDGKKLHEPLSAAGVPVTAMEIPQVTRFIAEAYRANDRVLPEARKVEMMGWQGKNCEHGFVAGTTHITAEQISKGVGGALHLGTMSPGERSLYNSVSSEGTIEGWEDAVRGVVRYPVATLAFLSGFAAPLMRCTGVKPFVIDIYGITTSGKTTAARLAASVWGRPTVEVEGYMHTWTTTSTALTVKLSHFADLVSIVDDTKTIPAKDKGEFQAGVVYTVANGQEKARATKDAGLRETRELRTILLTTGESSIVSGSKDAGTRARTLCLGDSPFPCAQTHMETGILLHHGVVGPLWVQWLIRQRDDWNAWPARHRELRASLTKEAPGAVAGRLSDPAALMLLAGELVEHRFRLGIDLQAVWDTLVKAMQQGHMDADQPREALEQVFAWALSRRETFWGSHPTNDYEPPPGGWLGWWEPKPDWEEIGIRRGVLEKALEERGYHPPDVIEQWLARGYLTHEKHRKDAKRPLGKHGERARMIVVRRDAVRPTEPKAQQVFAGV